MNAARADGGCSAARLQGPYVFSANAFRSFQGPQVSISGLSPVALLGLYVFDGAGNVSRSLSVSFAGAPSFPVGDAGTYVVNADCNGSVSFPQNGETLSFSILNSRTVAIATTTFGEVGVATLQKQVIKQCSLASLRGPYIFTSSGSVTFQPPAQFPNPPLMEDAFVPVSALGTLRFNGEGVVTRSMSSVDFGGFVFPYFDTGSYSVQADCTASVFFPSDQESFSMIFVDSKTVLLQVQTAGAVSEGSLVKQETDD